MSIDGSRVDSQWEKVVDVLVHGRVVTAAASAKVLEIKYVDYTKKFNGVSWVVSWKWKG